MYQAIGSFVQAIRTRMSGPTPSAQDETMNNTNNNHEEATATTAAADNMDTPMTDAPTSTATPTATTTFALSSSGNKRKRAPATKPAAAKRTSAAASSSSSAAAASHINGTSSNKRRRSSAAAAQVAMVVQDDDDDDEDDDDDDEADNTSAVAAASNKRRQPAASPDGADAPTASSPHSNILTPSLIALLADHVYTPLFLTTIFSHISQHRTSQPNWHVISGVFRQKLVEGGWTRESKYLLKKGTGKESEEKDEKGEEKQGETANIMTTAKHLVRSRHQIQDVTPAVCERLYTILNQRDRSTHAADELERLRHEHAEQEARVKEAQLPLIIAGKTHPTPPDLKLEFLGGLPKGVKTWITETTRSSEESKINGKPASSSSAPSFESTTPTTLDNWPGLTQSTAIPEYRMDGATIRRWMNGHIVHPEDELMHAANDVSPGVPVSMKTQFMSALSDLHHSSTRILNHHNRLVSTKQWLRGGLLFDMHQAFWSLPAAIDPSFYRTQLPTWTTPDDINLLDTVLSWLSQQSCPTPTSSFPQLYSEYGSSALLPRTVADWSSVREICQGWWFPCAFYRRRFWLLCQEATQAPAEVAEHARSHAVNDDDEAAVPPSIAPNAEQRNWSLENIIRKVDQITAAVTKREAEYIAKYGRPEIKVETLTAAVAGGGEQKEQQQPVHQLTDEEEAKMHAIPTQPPTTTIKTEEKEDAAVSSSTNGAISSSIAAASDLHLATDVIVVE